MSDLNRRGLLQLLASIIPASYLPGMLELDDDVLPPADHTTDTYNYRTSDPYEAGSLLTFGTVASYLLNGTSFDNLAAVLVADRPTNLDGMNLRQFNKISSPVRVWTRPTKSGIAADDISFGLRPGEKRSAAGAVVYDRSAKNRPALFFVSCGRPEQWPCLGVDNVYIAFHPDGLISVYV